MVKLTEQNKEDVLASVRSALNTENHVQTQIGFGGKAMHILSDKRLSQLMAAEREIIVSKLGIPKFEKTCAVCGHTRVCSALFAAMDKVKHIEEITYGGTSKLYVALSKTLAAHCKDYL